MIKATHTITSENISINILPPTLTAIIVTVIKINAIIINSNINIISPPPHYRGRKIREPKLKVGNL